MCDCKNCGCNKSNADGAVQNYDPKQIASYINKYIFDGTGANDAIQDAYVKVMVWLEDKKLPFTEDSISTNKAELKAVVNDPDYLKDKQEERPGWMIAVIIAAIAFGVYWLGKKA